MNNLRVLLVVFCLVVTGYTVVAIGNQGWNLYAYYFSNLAEMGWSGQFNTDFTTYLMLSGLWLAWRHHFSGVGLLIGFAGSMLGMPFLSAYLLIVMAKDKPDMAELLLGKARAAALKGG
jgi:hypothetical protein